MEKSYGPYDQQKANLKMINDVCMLITHSQWEAYMDLVENSDGGGGRQEIEEPQGL